MSTLFLLGFLFGLGTAFAGLVFMLSSGIVKTVSSSSESSIESKKRKGAVDSSTSKKELMVVNQQQDEKHIQAEIQVIDDALKFLNHQLKTKFDKTDVKQYLLQNSDSSGLKIPSSASITTDITQQQQQQSGLFISAERLEKCFNDLSKEAKDREKQIKTVSFLFNDLGKVYSSTARDISKVVQQSYNNVMKTDTDLIWDRWWSSLSKSLYNISLDNDSMQEVLLNDIVVALSKIQEEYSQVSKHLTQDGMNLILNLRQCQNAVDATTRDRNRCRVALDLLLTKPTTNNNNNYSNNNNNNNANNQAATPTAIYNIPGYQDNPRIISKLKYLQISENALLDASERVEIAETNYNKNMPKVIANFLAIAFKNNQECKVQILTFVNALNKIHGHNSIICQSLKADILSVFSVQNTTTGTSSISNLVLPAIEPAAVAVAGGVSKGLMGYEAELATSLTAISSHLAYKQQLQQQQEDQHSTASSSSSSSINASANLSTSEKGYQNIEMVDMKEKRQSLTQPPQQQTADGNNTNTDNNNSSAVSLASSRSLTGGDGKNKLNNTNNTSQLQQIIMPKLDMHAESTSVFAACSPQLLPPLPPSFLDSIGPESCVWFNALMGRMYRDMRSSAFFRYWTVAKTTYLFNKGHRPDYVDEFHIDNITFGSLPPLILNLRWIPPTATNSNTSPSAAASANATNNNNTSNVGANNASRISSTKGNNNVSTAASAVPASTSTSTTPTAAIIEPTPKTARAGDVNTNNGRGNSTKKNNNSNNNSPNRESTPPPQQQQSKADNISNANNTGSSNNNNTNNTGSSGNNNNNTHASSSNNNAPNNSNTNNFTKNEYELEYSADFISRSGIEIKISTRLWLNWPRDRYASIPVTLSVELSELTGAIRFGIDKTSAWISFIEEPFSRIKVTTEFGEQFKLKNVPKLSSWMTKKLKETMRNKLVYPNKHRVRLPWPRFWWPAYEGPELFTPSKLPILPIFFDLDVKVQKQVEMNNALAIYQFGDITLVSNANTSTAAASTTTTNNSKTVSTKFKVKADQSATAATTTKISHVKNNVNKLSNWFKKFNGQAADSDDVDAEGQGENDSDTSSVAGTSNEGIVHHLSHHDRRSSGGGSGGGGGGVVDPMEKKWQDVMTIQNRYIQRYISSRYLNNINHDKHQPSMNRKRCNSVPDLSSYHAKAKENSALLESVSFLPPVNARLRLTCSLAYSVPAELMAIKTTKTLAASSLPILRRSWTVSDFRLEQLELIGANLLQLQLRQQQQFELRDDDNMSHGDYNSAGTNAGHGGNNRLQQSQSGTGSPSSKQGRRGGGGYASVKNVDGGYSGENNKAAAALASGHRGINSSTDTTTSSHSNNNNNNNNANATAATKTKVNLDWISKVAKEKFIKFKTSNLSTVDTLSDVFLGTGSSSGNESPTKVASASNSNDNNVMDNTMDNNNTSTNSSSYGRQYENNTNNNERHHRRQQQQRLPSMNNYSRAYNAEDDSNDGLKLPDESEVYSARPFQQQRHRQQQKQNSFNNDNNKNDESHNHTHPLTNNIINNDHIKNVTNFESPSSILHLTDNNNHHHPLRLSASSSPSSAAAMQAHTTTDVIAGGMYMTTPPSSIHESAATTTTTTITNISSNDRTSIARVQTSATAHPISATTRNATATSASNTTTQFVQPIHTNQNINFNDNNNNNNNNPLRTSSTRPSFISSTSAHSVTATSAETPTPVVAAVTVTDAMDFVARLKIQAENKGKSLLQAFEKATNNKR